MKADVRTKEEIRAAIKKLTEAYKTRNLKGLMECFASDPDTILYGTGPDEKRTGIEEIRLQAERDWSQADSIEMSFMSSSISAAGNVSWAALDGAFNIQAGGQAMTIPVRVSLIFEKREGKWLIVHSHFSIPAADQVEGSSI